jgi:two-component system sensor histidine kinase ArlS
MTLRVRLSIVFAALSLLLLLGSLGYIYASHARSRQLEFYARLQAQCVRVASLLDEVRQADRDLLRVIDLNTIHRIHDEKVLLFNEDDELIYTSLDDEPIHYNAALLERIRQEGRVAYTDADHDEVVGLHYTANGADLVVLASAYDTYGKRELRNLGRTLLISLGLGLAFIFVAAYFYIGFVLRPIARLQQAIVAIDVDRLDQHLPVQGDRDEIDRLAISYNAMLERLRASFTLQRAFVHSASHELRTPLARMNAQVERVMALAPGSPELPGVLRTLQNDIAAQGALVESLLLLQRLQAHIPAQRSPVRVDEVLFSCLDELRVLHPDAHAEVDMDAAITDDGQLTVAINELLLRTALRNLLVNAVQYAPDHRVHVRVEPKSAGQGRGAAVALIISNAGDAPLPGDRVFDPFFRGRNSGEVRGSGLGLSIVRHVVEQAGGTVHYTFDGGHRFQVTLPTGK